jgi:hypothetical protein
MAALQLQVQAARSGGAFAISSIWAWECPSHRADMRCIWPGSHQRGEEGSDRMVRLLQEANRQMARSGTTG